MLLYCQSPPMHLYITIIASGYNYWIKMNSSHFENVNYTKYLLEWNQILIFLLKIGESLAPFRQVGSSDGTYMLEVWQQQLFCQELSTRWCWQQWWRAPAMAVAFLLPH